MSGAWHECLHGLYPDIFMPRPRDLNFCFKSFPWVAKVARDERHHWIGFRECPMLNCWAEISLAVDWILPPGEKGPIRGFRDPRMITLHYGSWNPRPVHPERWRERYPDVPFDRYIEFIFWHEIGHALYGSSEARADQHASEQLGIERMESNRETCSLAHVFKIGPWTIPSINNSYTIG